MKIGFNLKNFKNIDTLIWMAFLVFFGFLFYILKPLLINSVLIGWDLPAHYYLADQMLNYLQEFRISGYDLYGFAGYPMFTFYNPLPYIIVCFLHLLSFKFLSLYLSFNIILFILPFLYLVSVYYASTSFFNDKKISLASLLFGFLSLFLLGNNGLGIASEINVGLFLNAFAWPLMLFLLGTIEQLRQKKSIKYLIWSIILFSALILSHIFTALFFCFIFLIYTIFYLKQTWKQFFIIGFSAAILTSFWWVPFILNIGYTSAQGVVSTNNMDPIFSIFPRFLFGIFLFIFSLIGISRLIDRKLYFFPAIFIISILFIPRDIINSLINLPIHYYRFVSGVAVINVFISAYGFIYLMEWIGSWGIFKKGNFFSKIPWVLFLVIYLVVLMISVNFTYFKIEKFQKDFNPKNEIFLADIDDANKMATYIKSNNLQGRVLVDLESSLLLTKHYFDYILPTNKIYNARGLLYESSLSGRYIHSETGVLFNYSNLMTLVYIESKDVKEETQFFNNVNIDNSEKIQSEINKLARYGIKYIIVGNERRTPLIDFINSKYNHNLAIIKTTMGHFVLVEIQETASYVAKTNYVPFLFIDSGGVFKKISFADFSLQWQISDFSLDHLIIYANKPFEKISDYEKSQITGYIVSYKNNDQNCPSIKQMDYWVKQNKPVIFLDSDSNCTKPNENIYFIKTTEQNSEANQLHDLMEKLNKNKLILVPIEPELIQNEKIKFNNNTGTFINFSYFPKWQSMDKNQTVFWTTPSLMFIFSKGETELSYK